MSHSNVFQKVIFSELAFSLQKEMKAWDNIGKELPVSQFLWMAEDMEINHVWAFLYWYLRTFS